MHDNNESTHRESQWDRKYKKTNGNSWVESPIIEMKNSLKGLNRRFEMAEERIREL